MAALTESERPTAQPRATAEVQEPFRVVVADDAPAMRTLFRRTLELDGRFEVVAEAADGDEAVAAALDPRTELILLDLTMPGRSGLEIIPVVRAQRPDVDIVVLSASPAEEMAERSLALGAGAYLEKGGDVDELAESLARVAEAHHGRSRNAETVPASAPLAEPTTDGGAAMRRARWAGAVLALVQFTLYRPPAGVEVPFALVPAGAGIFAGLVGLNLISLAISRRRRPPAAWSLCEFVVDTTVVFAIVAAFSFDATSALWALLVIVALEGAMRYGLAGAIWGWALSAVFYVGREAWAASYFDDRDLEIESLTYRLGIVFIVALGAGSLARSLLESVKTAREAHHLARERARLLQLVATAARRVSAVDVDRVVEALLDCAIDIGCDAAEVSILDEPGSVWRTAQSRGLPVEHRGQPMPITSGLSGLVYRRNARVVIDDYTAWSGGIDEIRRLGFRHVAGFPVYVGGEMVAVLSAGVRSTTPLGEPQLECLELLAAQAGAALQNARLVEKMWHQATHDMLTGLPNQKLLEDRVTQALARAGRSGGHVALLYLDVDRFKKINDGLGHEAGNHLLQQVSERLLGATREADTVARLGGDEFIVLIPDLAAPAAATAAAEKIFRLFESPFTVSGREVYVTISLGMAVAPDDAATFEDLRKHADLAMYQGKRRGRNTMERYAADHVMAPAALDLDADLHHAVRRSELFLVYQPQIDLRSRQVVAAEALVRWRHPRRGILTPDAFLQTAEEAGLMESIDQWVLREACDQVRRWCSQGRNLRVAVNISAASFRSRDALTAMGRIVQQSGVDPQLIEFEVTETVTMEDAAAGASALRQLRAAGSRIAIDDFGTGFSMLGRLRQFPIDKLKIDKSFVQEVGVAGDDAPLLRAIISMALGLRLQVVAEGVETEQQAALVSGLGCDLAQGFLFGLPSAAVAGDDREQRTA